MPFDTIRVHEDPVAENAPKRLLVISYGNGVVTALRARELLREKHGDAVDGIAISVVDNPLLSDISPALVDQVGIHQLKPVFLLIWQISDSGQ